VLGHVNAALELAEQIQDGHLPEPARVIVPLGSGGTAAGLALGLEIAGLATTVVAVRVVPRIAASRASVLRLANATGAFMGRIIGEHVARVRRERVVVDDAMFGGAYGRPLAAGDDATSVFRQAAGLELDATYSAKAGAAAIRAAPTGGGDTLFWLTFDGRWLDTAPRRQEGQ
jgi:D-cysteine desulfhydrase